MNKEFEQVAEINALAEMLAGTFIQRTDLYARQLDDGRYVCVRKPLLEKHLISHLKGDLTLGTYVLDQDSRARFAVIDADDDLQLARLANIAMSLAQEGAPSYLESSRRGGHLWFFFEEPLPGKVVRSFGLSILESHKLSDIELFPKQNKLGDGPGSLIRLPFGVHRKNNHRYGFITPRGEPIAPTFAEQIRIMNHPRVVEKSALEQILKRGKTPKALPTPIVRSETNGGTLSERIKKSVSVLEFVGQYVTLSPNGRGLCPFHEDQHSSFAVNTDKNYWHCFAGCGGGSVIDFWMKLKGVNFKQAVRELSEILLNK